MNFADYVKKNGTGDDGRIDNENFTLQRNGKNITKEVSLTDLMLAGAKCIDGMFEICGMDEFTKVMADMCMTFLSDVASEIYGAGVRTAIITKEEEDGE